MNIKQIMKNQPYITFGTKMTHVFNYGPGQVFKISLAKVVNRPDGWTLKVNFIEIPGKFFENELLIFFTVMQFLG